MKKAEKIFKDTYFECKQMVQETLNNHRKHNKEWEEFLKA